MTKEKTRRPPRGTARKKLLDTAMTLIRKQGFAATSVDDFCRAAGVTKGAFFHHFDSKDDLAVAAAEHWGETTSAFFSAAPYHAPSDPLDRILAYVRFRRDIIAGAPHEFTCLAGTLVQETFDSHPAIREACREVMLGHADTLVCDIAAAVDRYGTVLPVDATSLARHTQAVLQGAFILAKADNGRDLALESVDHLHTYISLLFDQKPERNTS